MIEDIRIAMREQKRALARMTTLTPISPDHCRGVPSFKPEQIKAMLRIEVENSLQETIWREAHHDSELYAQLVGQYDGRFGPLTMEGVALYFVEKLPAPGWRVINPMLAKEAR